MGAAERVSVVRGQRMEPLLPGRPRYASGDSPWQGIVVERHVIGTTEIPLHEHRDFCMHVQLRGDVEMEWWCDGGNAVERPKAGALILLAPGTRDRLRWQGESERLILSVNDTFLRRAAEDAGLGEVPLFENKWLLHDEALRTLVTEMGREAEAGWKAGALYGDLLGLSFAQTLLRRQSGVALRQGALRGGLPMPRLRRVLEFVEAHLADDLRLEALAAVAGVSAFHFARMFRESTGVTPHQYVLQARVRLAQELMRAGRLSMAEVAAAAGFSSATNFVRSFRGRVGVTPGAWMASR